jgi:hypothetical protein
MVGQLRRRAIHGRIAMGTQPAGPIFVSYRRKDTAHVAGRIADRLIAHLPDRRVFLDVDSIGAGADFVEAVTTAVLSSDVVLVLIGDKWRGDIGEGGRSRLDTNDDVIRLELVTALDNDIPIIPILVDGASMPTQHELPAPMKALARRNAERLDYERFDQDVRRLLRALDGKLGEANSQGRPRSPDSSTGVPGGQEFTVVTTIGEVRALSRGGAVMLVTARAERGIFGQTSAVKTFRRSMFPLIREMCSPLGVKIAWANVGPLILGSELTRFMSDQGIRFKGCHLFVDGVLVGSQRADDLWGSEKWPTSVGAARILLEAHFPTSR